MSRFDFLFFWRRPAAPSSPDAQDATAQNLSSGLNWFAESDEEGYQVLAEALKRIGDGIIDEARLVRKRDEEGFLFRGNLAGHSIQLNTYLGGGIDILVKWSATQSNLEIWLERDVLTQDGADEIEFDPGWDDPEERRIYITPEIYVQGSEAEKSVRAYLRLPPEITKRIQELIETERILLFSIREKEISINFQEPMSMMPDPVQRIRTILGFLPELIAALHVEAPRKNSKEKGPHQLQDRHLCLHCRYCNAWYFQLPGTSPQCPHCGAPYDDARHPEA